MDIKETFKDFIENLKIQNKDEIRNRYEEITKSLNLKYYSSDSKLNNSLRVGSIGRRTAINQISDLDMLYIVPDSEFKRFDNHQTNGQSNLLQEIKTTIEKNSKYTTTGKKGDGQVVVVSFHNFRIEVLPAFKQSDGSFKYPDSNDGGSWKITKPQEEQKAITDKNNNTNDKLRHLAKMVRVWKNKHNVPMSGLLIDTLVYKFFESTDIYNGKSFFWYDIMVLDFFDFLSKEDERKYYFAYGSNQKVYVKKKFQLKAKKTLSLINDAIESNDKLDVNSKWKKVFGRPFPSAIKVITESYDESLRNWDNTEEFIEDKFPIDIRYTLKIDCDVFQNGFRENTLTYFLLNKIKLFPKKKLFFTIVNIDSEIEDTNYQIYWKILNRGEEAKTRNQIRGQIIKGLKTQEEHTSFSGEHIVECYIVLNGVVVAQDEILVPII